MKRVVIAGALVVGLALCGVGAYAGKQFFDQRSACESVRALIQKNGEVVKTSSGTPKVAIIGDSYVMGDGLADRTQGWAYAIGKIEGWDISADGISSTGYTNGGFCGGQEFLKRIDTVLATKPRTLIIEGGLNDWKADPASLNAAASKVLDAAAGVPNVIVVGPPEAPSRAESVATVDASLRSATESHGRQYISALGWKLDYLPDNLHLTASSHVKFAELIAQKVSAP